MSSSGFRSLGSRSSPRTPVRAATTSSSQWFSIPMSPYDCRDSDAFWQTPQKTRRSWRLFHRSSTPITWSYRIRHNIILAPLMGLLMAVVVVAGLLITTISSSQRLNVPDASEPMIGYQPLRPISPQSNKKLLNPVRWLQENSNNKYALSEKAWWQSGHRMRSQRPRAAIISLVRNSEVKGMIQSMKQLEYRWNKKYQYPWVFFNDEPFTEEFKKATSEATSAKCFYETVPKEHWSLPEWIDKSRFDNSLEYLGSIGVGKGWMVSYHHMCRWNSGFFYKHPRLQNYDWYWRIEPDVHYFCDIDYDVFRFMSDNDLKYGFNMNILDDARSFPSLWPRTKAFMASHQELMHPDSDISWLLDPQSNNDYNNCQFFSNFEIGSLNFWRGPQHRAYFDWLDKAGGFYYERFGDAPVHTLSVAMFLPKNEVWYFRDIGYQHDINRVCPSNLQDRCACEPTNLDEGFYKLVPKESPQRKPPDTCIRGWLGGNWTQKRNGWTAEGEKMFGGDGYHGYVVSGDA